MVQFGDRRGERRGDARIDRVAALFEDLRARGDFQIVAGPHHEVRAPHHGEHGDGFWARASAAVSAAHGASEPD